MLDAVPEKVLERIKESIPLGRLGEPEEVARVVRFLASDNAGYITGQVWGVNGRPRHVRVRHALASRRPRRSRRAAGAAHRHQSRDHPPPPDPHA